MMEHTNRQVTTVKIPPSAAGERLSDVLARLGHPVSSPCGGRGVCGKCRVQVLGGQFLTRNGQPIVPDGDGTVPACQAVCPADGAEVLVRALDGAGLSLGTSADGPASGKYGFALDVGTTTLAAVRVSLPDGRVTASASCLNPQQAFGADVISRIGACKAGHLSDLQTCVLEAVRGLISRLTPAESGSRPPLTVAGNATMLHLFAGISPESMGHYPFTPAYTGTMVTSGDALGLPVGSVTLLPSVSAFVGGDITAGMKVCGMGKSTSPILLLDIGTNGEMVLDTGRERIGTSTAAGPALEGANISCGMGGVSGAVSSVKRDGDELVYTTIGDAPAVGLCGSGLLDFTARLLEDETVDETGFLEDDASLSGRWKTADGLSDAADVPSVTLTQKDIREVQLAKSAIRAGLEALLAEADMTPDSFIAAGGTVYLAGGLGYYLDPQSAAAIGLLPPVFLDRLVPAGNTALKGACAALTDQAALDDINLLSRSCRIFDLEKSEVFNDGFIEYMMFPETEE